jgi:hypothetical protein
MDFHKYSVGAIFLITTALCVLFAATPHLVRLSNPEAVLQSVVVLASILVISQYRQRPGRIFTVIVIAFVVSELIEPILALLNPGVPLTQCI